MPLSPEFIWECIRFAQSYQGAHSSSDSETTPPSITTSTFSSLGFGGDAASSATSHSPDPHAVSEVEAQSYYAGLPSEPTLVYRTGKQWSPPRRPETQCRLKELREVFDHPIADPWHHDLAFKVASVMDDHKIRFTTIDVVRFKTVKIDEAPEDEEEGGGRGGGKVEEEGEDEEEGEGEEEGEDEKTVQAEKPVLSPVTIWIGVFPGSTTPTAAHDAAQSVLALLQKHQITDVDVDFRESIYMRNVGGKSVAHKPIARKPVGRKPVGPRLLNPVAHVDPLVDVITPLTPVLGLRISTTDRPNAQGTMALYLAEGGGSDSLLGLSCHHVLFGSDECDLDYTYNRSKPSKDVLLLSEKAYTDVVDSIKLAVAGHTSAVGYWKWEIARLEKREKGDDAADVARAKAQRIETEGLVSKGEKAMEELAEFHAQVEKQWEKIDNRVIGYVLRSPPLAFGISEQHFTEDWGIFEVEKAKLGDGFEGNKIDLGTNMTSQLFKDKCFPRGDADWEVPFSDGRLLPLWDLVTNDLMRQPDMRDKANQPCLLVVKRGNATGITFGRATGVFSVVRDYFSDTSINQTSMEWGIFNYDRESDNFSEPGDSGSIIADVRGRIGGMLTAGSGKTQASDMTYATPFWWLLGRIQAQGFPHANLNVGD